MKSTLSGLHPLWMLTGQSQTYCAPLPDTPTQCYTGQRPCWPTVTLRLVGKDRRFSEESRPSLPSFPAVLEAELGSEGTHTQSELQHRAGAGRRGHGSPSSPSVRAGGSRALPSLRGAPRLCGPLALFCGLCTEMRQPPGEQTHRGCVGEMTQGRRDEVHKSGQRLSAKENWHP